MAVHVPDLLLSVLDDVEPLMQAAFDAASATAEPDPALTQVFLLDGREVIVDYLTHGELGLALDHLVYMIVEPRLSISHDTHRRLQQAGTALNYPPGSFSEIAVD